VEDVVAEMRRLEAARGSLAWADWFEDPDALQPGEWLTLGARPEEIRRAYQRYDARFELDQFGELKLRLEPDLEDEGVANGSHPSPYHRFATRLRVVATPGRCPSPNWYLRRAPPVLKKYAERVPITRPYF
jgi:hypothetical protein